MKKLSEHLHAITKLERRRHHPMLHKVHETHGISRRTLLYVKEYGPHSNVPRTIIKESIKVLLIASLISSLGGLMLERIKDLFVVVIPLVILLPAMNGMIGDFGIIFSSRFANLLHEGKVGRSWKKNMEIRKLLLQILVISLITTSVSAAIALAVSYFSGYAMDWGVVIKVFFISIIDALLLVSILFITAIFAGLYFFKKNEDPDNFLIPITTSIADLGNIILLALLVIFFF